MTESKAKTKVQIPELLPILQVQGSVLYPQAALNVSFGAPQSVNAIKIILESDKLVGIVASKDPETGEETGQSASYNVGTVGIIEQVQQEPPHPFPVQVYHLLIKGLERFRIVEIISEDPSMVARIELLPEENPDPSTAPVQMEGIKALYKDLLDVMNVNPDQKPYLLRAAMKPKDAVHAAHTVLSLLPDWLVKVEELQNILEIDSANARLEAVIRLLQAKILTSKLRQEVKESLDKQQRRFVVQEQIRILQKEIGEDNPDIRKYKEGVAAANMPPAAKKEAEETLESLRLTNRQFPEYSYLAHWLDWMIALPWDRSTQDNQDFIEAQRILNQDHYGLEKVKERVLEFLVVRQRKPNGHGPILCFTGPPGTGKTSVGKSIAQAMGRNFVRISLGGVEDEAEIRGHRRTYIGSLPGAIIQEIKKAGSNNPVFMIDEVDKIGRSAIRGDPSSALLEALDPAQNHAFADHYLGMPFDLSKVMFICTANMAETIQPALLDRMEIIEFTGYTREEKLQIAKLYLAPRQLEEAGLTNQDLAFSDDGLECIASSYTREAGVRNLEREIGNVCRKVAVNLARGELVGVLNADSQKIEEVLGPHKYSSAIKESSLPPGVATGLAVTPFGGTILLVETALIPEAEPNLEVTGNIEKIMSESAKAALTFVTANLQSLNIPEERSPVNKKVHIHVPEGATPKDGPSAGITIFVALVSLLTNREVRADVAMTGEITLRGKVLKVGGIKEKVLAAKEAGVKTVILPQDNEGDITQLPQSVKDAVSRGDIEIKLVSEMREVLEIVFNNR